MASSLQGNGECATTFWLLGCTPIHHGDNLEMPPQILGMEGQCPWRVVLASPGHQVASPVPKLSLVHAHRHTHTSIHVCTHTVMAHTNIYPTLYDSNAREVQGHPLFNLKMYPQWSKEFNQENKKV